MNSFFSKKENYIILTVGLLCNLLTVLFIFIEFYKGNDPSRSFILYLTGIVCISLLFLIGIIFFVGHRLQHKLGSYPEKSKR